MSQLTFSHFKQALETIDLGQEVRRRCLKLLYKTCSGHIILPRSLQIELPGIPTGDASYHGGFGDVWKCEYLGQEVAVKVLRKYANSDLNKLTRVSPGGAPSPNSNIFVNTLIAPL